MALRTAIGSCARIQWWRARAGPRRTLASRSCEGGDAEPCPPCPPQPPPPCRGLRPERVRATRVVCCPPPQGNPPPCAPPCINPPLTCAEAVTKTRRTGRISSCAAKEVCGVELDRVALRLQKAAQYRRQNYEQEVAQRKACREPFPELVPYSLGAKRECCHATDGKDYHMVKCGPPETPPCGPNRTPPPPRCVELVRDTECQVSGPRHVDPCAHKPRNIVEIDRSRQREPKAQRHTETRPEKATTMCGNRAGSAPPAPTRKFTTRLMESLSLTRNTEATKSCPRRSCDGKCDGEGARRAGDHGWCSNLKPPPAVPLPCRKPTSAELLKQRPPSRCGPNDPRCFHTAAALGSKSGDKKAPSPAQMKADTEKLEKALKERESYNEAGHGRVATEEALSSSKSRDPTASLDVCIPPGAEKLSVRVLVDEGGCKKKPKCKKPPKYKEEVPAKAPKAAIDKGAAAAPPASAVGRCHSVATNHSEKRESWLSIKSLLANCRKDNSHTPTCPTTKITKNPCGSPPPGPPSKAPPAPSPCKPVPNPSPSKAPPRPLPCKCPAAPSPCNKPNKPSPSPCNKPNAPSPSPCKPATPPSPCKKDQPTKPKQDPCSSKKTKFTPEKTLELETFLLKW